MFAAHGLSVPRTWADFLAACDVFQKANIQPLVLGNSKYWPVFVRVRAASGPGLIHSRIVQGWFDYINMRTNGPEFHISLLGGNVPFTDPRVVNVLEELKGLFDKGYFGHASTYVAQDWYIQRIMLCQGTAGMTLMGDFLRDVGDPYYKKCGWRVGPSPLPFMRQRTNMNFRLRSIDFFQFPIMDPTVKVGEDAPTDGWLVSANARNIPAAEAWIAMQASAAFQMRQVNQSWINIPSNKLAFSAITDPLKRKGAAMVAAADYVCQYFDRDTDAAMVTVAYNSFLKWLNTTPKDHAVLLKELEAARQEVFLGLTAAPTASTGPDTSVSSTKALSISLSCTTASSKIYFTLDGSKPTTDSQLYVDPIHLIVSGRYTLRAIAVAPNLQNSPALQIVFTLDLETVDAVSAGSAIAGLTVSILSIVFLIGVMVAVHATRRQPIMKAASPVFVNLMIAGFIVALLTGVWLSMVPALGIPDSFSDTACALQLWSICIGWAIAFGALFAKTYRVARLFHALENNKLSEKIVPTNQLFVAVGISVAIEVFILLGWQFVDPLHMSLVNVGHGVDVRVCRSSNNTAWLVITLVPKVAMLLIGIVLCIRTRNIFTAFNGTYRYSDAVACFIRHSAYTIRACSGRRPSSYRQW